MNGGGAGLAAGAALAVMLACAALGSAAGGGRGRLPGADAVVGLGLAGGLLTVLAVARAPVSLGAGLLGAAGLAALAWSAWRRRLPGGAGFAAALLLASPLLAFAALGPATMWDDFAQWLPNAAYVFQHDALPSPGQPNTASRHPGYPPILPFIVASASWLAGRFLEAAGPVANAVLLASAGAAVADAAAAGLAGRLACAAAVAGAFLLLFFPELPRNVLFSSYADTATIAAFGVLGLLGAALLERLPDNAGEARPLAWRFGLAAAALLNLKQANLVLLALLSLGLLLAAWRSGRLRWPALLRLLPPMLLPAALVYLVWRHYLKHNLPEGEMAFQPPAAWNWASVPSMLNALGYEIGHNLPFHGLMWAVTLAGLWKLRSPQRPAEWLAVAAALVWIGYNGFLIVVYLGAMIPEEARIAADYWRYTPHAGLLAVAAALLWLGQLPWPAAVLRHSRPLLLGVAALLPVSLLAAGPGRLSALAKPWPMQARAVGRELADLLPPGARLAPAVGFDYGYTYYAIGHDLHRFGRDDRNLQVCCWWKGPTTLAMFQSGEATHLLVADHLGSQDAVTRPLGIPDVAGESALFEWTGAGFRKVRSWPFPRAAPAN